MPDYQRLRQLTQRIPELKPTEILVVVWLRTVAEELASLLQESLDRYGISEGRLRVLGHLLDSGQMTHSDLAATCRVTKGTVTGLVDGLEREGLVRRTPSPDDRRVSLIELTPEGEQTIERILPGHMRRLTELVGGVGETEQKQLIELLQTLRAGYAGRLSPCGDPKPVPTESGAAKGKTKRAGEESGEAAS